MKSVIRLIAPWVRDKEAAVSVYYELFSEDRQPSHSRDFQKHWRLLQSLRGAFLSRTEGESALRDGIEGGWTPRLMVTTGPELFSVLGGVGLEAENGKLSIALDKHLAAGDSVARMARRVGKSEGPWTTCVQLLLPEGLANRIASHRRIDHELVPARVALGGVVPEGWAALRAGKAPGELELLA